MRPKNRQGRTNEVRKEKSSWIERPVERLFDQGCSRASPVTVILFTQFVCVILELKGPFICARFSTSTSIMTLYSIYHCTVTKSPAN